MGSLQALSMKLRFGVFSGFSLEGLAFAGNATAIDPRIRSAAQQNKDHFLVCPAAGGVRATVQASLIFVQVAAADSCPGSRACSSACGIWISTTDASSDIRWPHSFSRTESDSRRIAT